MKSFAKQLMEFISREYLHDYNHGRCEYEWDKDAEATLNEFLKKHKKDSDYDGVVYPKNVSPEQAELIRRFYNHTCFELMNQDEIRAGDPKGFYEIWRRNCDWLDDVLQETRDFIGDYYNKYYEEIEEDEIDDADEEEG